MAIMLINKDERFVGKSSGAEFYYRRATIEDYRRIVKENTHRGVEDQMGIAVDLLKFCLLGWDGTIVDAAGKPAPFSAEAVGYLPGKVIREWSEIIGENIAGEKPVDPTRTSGSTSEP